MYIGGRLLTLIVLYLCVLNKIISSLRMLSFSSGDG